MKEKLTDFIKVTPGHKSSHFACFILFTARFHISGHSKTSAVVSFNLNQKSAKILLDISGYVFDSIALFASFDKVLMIS